MALAERDAVCTHCRKPMHGTPMRSFLGFQKFICPSCRTDFLYPLTNGYRNLYWVFVVLFGALSTAAILMGKIAFPGALVIVGIIGLIKDASIKKQVAAAEAAAEPMEIDDGAPPQA